MGVVRVDLNRFPLSSIRETEEIQKTPRHGRLVDKHVSSVYARSQIWFALQAG